jgi:hypothetical protein
MLGSHCIKHWSSTQASVALSSGEAEFAGVIRGAGQGLGYKALLQDLGVGARLRVWTDSSAAIGICNRQGLGKLRHLDTHTLWIQQAVRTGRVDLRKVLGEENPADLLTKHSLSRQRLEKLVELHGCKYLGGRAASAPQVRAGESTRTTMASGGGGLIGAAGDGTSGAAQTARVGEIGIGAVDGGTLHGSGTPGEEPTTNLGSGSPTMPHLVLHGQRLDDAYPPLAVPEDDDLQDAARDEDDATFQTGLREAVRIAEEARDQGRKRKMSPTASTTASTPTTTTTTTTTGGPLLDDTRKKTEGTVDLVADQDEGATVRWTLGRWRSSKEVLGPGGLEPPSEPPLKDSEGHRKKQPKRSSHHVSIDCLRCVTLSAQPRACVLHCIGPSCVYPN